MSAIKTKLYRWLKLSKRTKTSVEANESNRTDESTVLSLSYSSSVPSNWVNSYPLHSNAWHLFKAIGEGRLDVVRQLLEEGTELDCTDGSGHTLLYWAVKSRRTDVAQTLLDYGAAVKPLTTHRTKMGRLSMIVLSEAIINSNLNALEMAWREYVYATDRGQSACASLAASLANIALNTMELATTIEFSPANLLLHRRINEVRLLFAQLQLDGGDEKIWRPKR